MIFGNINNIGDEKKYPAIILEGLKTLKEGEWDKKENGRYELKGEKMYISISEYETAPEETKKPEVHRKYIDIQYLFEGEEVIKVATDLGENKINKEYNETNDIMFYESALDEVSIIMTPGSFAVFYPNDIHTPGCNYKNKSKIRKAVLKISIDL